MCNLMWGWCGWLTRGALEQGKQAGAPPPYLEGGSRLEGLGIVEMQPGLF